MDEKTKTIAAASATLEQFAQLVKQARAAGYADELYRQLHAEREDQYARIGVMRNTRFVPPESIEIQGAVWRLYAAAVNYCSSVESVPCESAAACRYEEQVMEDIYS